MIREVCSCGAEFETDLPEQVALLKKWRKAHKHEISTPSPSQSILTNTETIGFVRENDYEPEDLL